jgi:hypothetical protein
MGHATNAVPASVQIYFATTDTAYPGSGGHAYYYIDSNGSELVVNCAISKTSESGIYSLYINGVLDSAGYDFCDAGGVTLQLNITITPKLVTGINTIEFRCTGKNGASTDYSLSCYGVRLR